MLDGLRRMSRRAWRQLWRCVRIVLFAFMALGPGVPPPPPVPRRPPAAQIVGAELDDTDPR
jgi:hypothetical protein